VCVWLCEFDPALGAKNDFIDFDLLHFVLLLFSYFYFAAKSASKQLMQ